MAATSRTLALGTEAPPFQLADAGGAVFSDRDFAGARGLLVAFICNHCPYVVHVKPGLAQFARDYQEKGLAVVAINANDPTAYPADAPPRMAEDAERFGYVFPYLFDESQAVAAAYGAVCTPEFFLFDGQRRLAYHGQFDASRPRSGAVATGADLRAAADAVLAGRPVASDQKPAVGCSIKWRPQS
jgi:thiol-disulfide isomerase/thioredoxin